MQKTFFNRLIMFAEGVMIVVATCSAVNLYQVRNDIVGPNISSYLAYAFAAIFAAYTLSITIYLCRNL